MLPTIRRIANMPVAYCVKCKVKNEMKSPVPKSVNNRHMLSGTCPKCGTKMTVFVKAPAK